MHGAHQRCAEFCLGADRTLYRFKRLARTKAARNPPRHGRERSLSFAARIGSAFRLAPEMQAASATPRRESFDFTPKANRAERVQTVNMLYERA
jgi:hypothetical protein